MACAPVNNCNCKTRLLVKRNVTLLITQKCHRLTEKNEHNFTTTDR